MHNLARGEIQAMISELDQAVVNHEQWHDEVTKTLVCQLLPDPRFTASQAHRECEFGKWYYSGASKGLRTHPRFAAIEAQHELVHRTATRLLEEMAAGKPVTAEDYSGFADALARLHFQLRALDSELRSALGNLDPLTGAHNRAGMFAALREQQELVKRQVHSCCIAMIDLDLFKSVNDFFGHVAGDQVLAHTARYLMDHIRVYDELYRYGGEEFLLCMPGVDLTTGFGLVDRLREGLGRTEVRHGGATIHFHVSCGVALLDPVAPIEESISRADKAMYAAKAAGRNCMRVWDPAMV